MRHDSLRRLISQPNMWPLLAIDLVLFMCFCTMMPMPYGHGVSVELVPSRSARPIPRMNRSDALIINILRDGKVYFDREQVGARQLSDQIALAVRTSQEHRVYIKADSRARYKLVKDVLDCVPFYLANRITFVTDNR